MNPSRPIYTLDNIEALADQITPGPWQLCAHLAYPNENGCECGYRGVVFGRDDYAICQPGHEVNPDEEGLEPPRLPRDEEIANMRAVSLVPELIRELIDNRKTIKDLRDRLNITAKDQSDATA